MGLAVSNRGRMVALLALMAAGALAGLAAAASSRDSAIGHSTEPRLIEIVARRYAFEPAEIEVRRGERVRLLVKSGDGLHGFEITRFKIAKELPRGADPIAIEFAADEAGRFPILCSVFCGDGHDDMKGALVVTAVEATP